MLKLTRFIASSLRQLLAQPPRQLLVQSVRAFKDKDVLKLRCKDCYFKKVDTRWMVLCTTQPRHKQRERIEDIRTSWIVTHATFGGRAFQKKEEAYICNLAPPGPFDYKRKTVFADCEKTRRGNGLIGRKGFNSNIDYNIDPMRKLKLPAK